VVNAATCGAWRPQDAGSGPAFVEAASGFAPVQLRRTRRLAGDLGRKEDRCGIFSLWPTSARRGLLAGLARADAILRRGTPYVRLRGMPRSGPAFAAAAMAGTRPRPQRAVTRKTESMYRE